MRGPATAAAAAAVAGNKLEQMTTHVCVTIQESMCHQEAIHTHSAPSIVPIRFSHFTRRKSDIVGTLLDHAIEILGAGLPQPYSKSAQV